MALRHLSLNTERLLSLSYQTQTIAFHTLWMAMKDSSQWKIKTFTVELSAVLERALTRMKGDYFT